MGRAKQSMKLTREERIRNTTFRKRKEGLKKKAGELSVLCDVQVCLIVYGPPMDGSAARDFEIWPPNRDKVQSLIHSYNNQSNEDKKDRTANLTTIYKKKCKKTENDLLKLKEKNEMAKYAMWDECYSNFSYAQLLEFGSLLDAKLANVRNRIETMKGSQICSSSTTFFNDLVLPQHQPISSPFKPSETAFPMNYIPFHQTQQGNIEEDLVFNHPSMMMMNNDLYYNSASQFGGISSNNVPYINGCFGDSTLGNFTGPCGGYFGDFDTQMMPSYMQNYLSWDDQKITKGLN